MAKTTEMFVKDILNYSKDDKEADIVVSDGIYDVICYDYPIRNNLLLNKKISTIHAYLASNIIKSDEEGFSIKKLSSYYSYVFVARVVSVEHRLVQIGMLMIYLDESIPLDIRNGDYISFKVSRLDAIVN